MFSGFHNEEGRVPLPESFFAAVLPQITNLAELKVTLHVLWRLAAQVGQPRLVGYSELLEDGVLVGSLTAGRNPRPAEEWLREGLELAVTRGTLLRLVLEIGGAGPQATEDWYLANTPFNARWLVDVCDEESTSTAGLASAEWLALLRTERAAARGQLTAAEVAEQVVPRLSRHRPGIFELYEQNIGVITPLLAEQLADAERLYPPRWIEEAFTEAVNYNKRNWKYVRRILENWAAKGKDNGARGQGSSQPIDPDKYLRGKYAHLFNRE